MSASIKKMNRLHQSLMAALLRVIEGYMHVVYGQRKRSVFHDLPATIVEIGPGTGANMRYYPPGSRVIAVEPNPAMHHYLHQAARRYGLQLDLRGMKGEHLDLDTNSVDAVVSTLVLCSVDDPARVVSEIRRVLKPGGRFIYLEHVAAMPDTALARMQNILHRIWLPLFDGCRLNRHTWTTINTAGFQHVDMDCFTLKSSWIPVSPHIFGVAVK
jgi:ubiquinone/menaquinone biosynthesis C-methylase UbiE